MERTEILNNLIKDGEKLTSTISFVKPAPGTIRAYSLYRTSEEEKYQTWLSASQRFIKIYFPSDLEDVKNAVIKLNPKSHQKLLGILRAIYLMPEEPINLTSNKGTNITINNSQQIAINIFKEVLKDELTGKEYKELKEIMDQYEMEPEKAKPKMKEKIKKLGNDVLANILANILTNPNIFGG